MKPSARQGTVFRIGPFEFDLSTGELHKEGRRQKLPPQPAQILSLLARRPGELVTREEIEQQVWGKDTFVDFERRLNTCIKQLRQALADDAESPRYIETLPRRGYRLIAPVQIEPRLPARSRWRQALLTVAAVLVAAGVYFSWQALTPAPTGSAQKVMLLVLPFENLNGDPEKEYFADGLTEEMISALGRVHPQDLGVIARTSAMHYKTSKKTIQQIGRELAVDYVLEGSVQLQGERVRINARLSRVGDESVLWMDTYDREFAEVLELQDELARRVATSLAEKLLAEPPVLVTQEGTADPEAHEAYLRGLHFQQRFTPMGLRKSLDYFERAIEIDPEYALPYVGLAATYAILAHDSVLPAEAAIPRSNRLIAEALELQPNLSEAHAQLGFNSFLYEWDFSGAEREFQRAIALNPSNATAHHGYASCLAAMGRFEDAFREMERARRLDPLSLIVNADSGFIRYFAGQYDRAIIQLQQTIELDPSFAPAHAYLGRVYAAMGSYDKAVSTYLEGWTLFGYIDSAKAARLRQAYAASGWKGFHEAQLPEMISLQAQGKIPPYHIAATYASLSDKEQTFRWLERGLRRRYWIMSFLKVNPKFDFLRDDPRFQALLRRMHFPE